MKQDTWQLLNDKWSRPIDNDGIFLGKYVLIVSLSVHDTFCLSTVIPASYFAGIRSLAFETNSWRMQIVHNFKWLEKLLSRRNMYPDIKG